MASRRCCSGPSSSTDDRMIIIIIIIIILIIIIMRGAGWPAGAARDRRHQLLRAPRQHVRLLDRAPVLHPGPAPCLYYMYVYIHTLYIYIYNMYRPSSGPPRRYRSAAEIEYTQRASRRTMLCLAAAAGAGRSGPLPAAAAGSGPQLLKQPAAAGSGPRQRVRRRAAAASLRGSRLDGLPEVPALISSLDPTRAPAGQGRVHHGDLCVWASTGVWPHSTC